MPPALLTPDRPGRWSWHLAECITFPELHRGCLSFGNQVILAWNETIDLCVIQAWPHFSIVPEIRYICPFRMSTIRLSYLSSCALVILHATHFPSIDEHVSTMPSWLICDVQGYLMHTVKHLYYIYPVLNRPSEGQKCCSRSITNSAKYLWKWHHVDGFPFVSNPDPLNAPKYDFFLTQTVWKSNLIVSTKSNVR